MALRVYAQEIQDEKSQPRSWEEIVQQIATGALLRITVVWLTYSYCYGISGSTDTFAKQLQTQILHVESECQCLNNHKQSHSHS